MPSNFSITSTTDDVISRTTVEVHDGVARDGAFKATTIEVTDIAAVQEIDCRISTNSPGTYTTTITATEDLQCATIVDIYSRVAFNNCTSAIAATEYTERSGKHVAGIG